MQTQTQAQPVNFVVAPQPVNFVAATTPQGINNLGGVGYTAYMPASLYPAPLQYAIAKPSKAQANNTASLHKTVTLILQLYPGLENLQLLPQERTQVQQLLLNAAYILETANCTPLHLQRIVANETNVS